MKLAAIHACDVAGGRLAAPGADRLRRSIFRILEENMLCSMATITGGRRAHINTAYFAYAEDLDLYFLSHPRARHCRNLATNRSMAMTIFSSSQPWASPGRGLQLFGTCGEARGEQAKKAERAYAERFPAYARWQATLAREDLARAYRFYRLRVRKLKVLDEKNLGDALFVWATVTRG